MRNVKRKEILEKGFKYPQNLVTLVYTNHIKQRIEQRCDGLVCLPTVVRPSEKNIYSGRTKDEKSLVSVVVRFHYTSKLDLFLCFNPRNGKTITMWFNETLKGKNPGNSGKQAVRDDSGTHQLPDDKSKVDSDCG